MNTVPSSAPGDGSLLVRMLPLLDEGSERDLRTLQIKLTYLGVQKKSRPTVVFTTFYHVIQLGWFLPLRKVDLQYANDEAFLLNFTVTPAEMKHVVGALRQADVLNAPDEAQAPFLSLMLVLSESRLGQLTGEAILAREAAATLSKTIYDALDQDNGVGQKVIALQQQLIGA